MSTRSSPLSSPALSPAPNDALSEVLPMSSQQADPRGLLSPLSSSSSLSNDDELEHPPSSLPNGSEGAGSQDSDGEGGSGSETSATVPLGSQHSDSDLTEESDDEELPGPPVGIRPSVVPESVADSGMDVDGEDGLTPQPNRAKTTMSASSTPHPAPIHSRGRAAPKSPSLSPPPPGESARAAAASSAKESSPGGIKRKRDSEPPAPSLPRTNGFPTPPDSNTDPKPNGHVIGVGAEMDGGPESLSPVKPTRVAEAEDLPLPENEDPDAQMAFLEAIESFDFEDLGGDGGKMDDVVEVGAAEPEQPVEGEGDSGDTLDVAMRDEDGKVEEDIARPTEEAEPERQAGGMEELMEAAEASAQAEPVEEQAKGASKTDAGDPTESAPATAVMPNGATPSPLPTEETMPPPPLSRKNSAVVSAPSSSAGPSTLHPMAHAHSSHAPPPSQAAMRALLQLELKFAALRDRLYIERMEEAAEEEEMILNGTHPALQKLHKTLSHRRERLHELASRRHEQALDELKVVRKSEQNAVWSWWTDERDRMHWEEFEQTWSKRRRLAREKNEIESVRWAKPVPKVGDPRFGKSFDWSAGPSPARLTVDEGNHDLALMEHRQMQLSRHASPAIFPPLPNYPMSHQQQPQNQQPANQYASVPYAAGPTYAEAAGTSSQTANIPQTYDSPRVPSSGATPQSRQNTSNTAHQSAPTSRQVSGSAQTAAFGGPGLMDHYAYPRNATALGPTSSGSSISLSQPGQSLSHSQTQQQRREGRTVPTASTMFGPNSTPNANSPIAQSFPFNQAQNQAHTASHPVNPNAPSNAQSQGQNAISKEVKAESMDYSSPWGNRMHVPMGFGLGFGLGGGGIGGGAGFGTLGSSAGGMRDGTSLPSAAGPGQGLGQSAYAASLGRKQDDKVGMSTVNGVNGVMTSASTPGGAWGANGGSKIHRGAEDVEMGNGLDRERERERDREREDARHREREQRDREQREREDRDRDRERERERDRMERDRMVKEDRDRERERDRPKYPGLAEYLGGSTNPLATVGLARMGVRPGGILSPPRSGVSRSPFTAPPPVPAPNTQTVSRT